MLVGNVHYIISHYNELKFQLLLENHLKTKQSGAPLSKEFIEEGIAAFLELKNSNEKEYIKMDELLTSSNILYSDCRAYTGKQKVNGNPLDSITAFNKLYNDFLLKTQKDS